MSGSDEYVGVSIVLLYSGFSSSNGACHWPFIYSMTMGKSRPGKGSNIHFGFRSLINVFIKGNAINLP